VSTLTNLLETLESWTRLLEEGFDIDVPRKHLLEKIRGLGLDKNLQRWIGIFYMTGR